MKNVRYIAPIESMSGNLSGKQELLYPTKNNSAWESPSDKRNYATNYRPRYVGTYRAKNGKVSFQVKQRSAVTMSTSMRKQQAVLGGTKAIYDALIHNPLTISRMQALYMQSPERNTYGWSMYKWAYSQISGQVENKIAGIRIVGKLGQTTLLVQNPWISTPASGAVSVTISDDILAKFWMQLANDPIEFMVNTSKGIAHTNNYFLDIIDGSFNVLGLTHVELKVKMGDFFVCFDHNGTKYNVVTNGFVVKDYPTRSFYLSETAGTEWDGGGE